MRTPRFGDVGRARLAVLALLGSVLVPLAVAGLRSLLWLLVAFVGLALTAAGVWWALAHTGVVRGAGVALAVAAPTAVLVVYALAGMLATACVSLALWVLAVATARTALTPGAAVAGHAVTGAPEHPWLLLNPRSGGGKAQRFHLLDKAQAAGCRVFVLDGHQDVAQLAHRAVADGADLLAVAGGDGTQALIAEVAAHYDLPFMVIPAGTRNHFALDLGLDRENPAAALEALTDAEEFRVDLGYAADRVFVNNASFGTYATVVADPAYRDAKLRTILRTLPDLLSDADAPRLRMRADDTRLERLQAVLVSNNRYGRVVDANRPGRRERLDSGELGVGCLRLDNAAQAARTVSGPGAKGIVWTAAETVVVETDTTTLPVGIDGETVVLPAPVVCRSAPGVLRVRVPRHRPGRKRTAGAPADWPRVVRLALRGRPAAAPRRTTGDPPVLPRPEDTP